MKKFLSILLASLLLVALLAACGEGDNNADGGKNETPSSTSTQPTGTKPTGTKPTGTTGTTGTQSSSTGEQHTCKGTGEWFFDLNNHWRFCECGEMTDKKSHNVGSDGCGKCSVEIVEGFDGDFTLTMYDANFNPYHKQHYTPEFVMDEESWYTYVYSENDIVLSEKLTVNDVLIYEITNDSHGNITQKLEYDADGQVTATSTWEYTYAEDGNKLSEKAYEEGNITYECYYVAAQDGYVTDYDIVWNEDGKIKTSYYANGDISGKITYDAEGNATETLGYVYEYDGDGNITKETCTKNEALSYISSFCMDEEYGMMYMFQKVVYQDDACYTTTYDVNGKMLTATGVDAEGNAIDHSSKFDAEVCAPLVGTWEGTVVMDGGDLGIAAYEHMKVTSHYTVTIDAEGNMITHYVMDEDEYMALLVEVYVEVILDQLRDQMGDGFTKIQLETMFENSYGMSIREYIETELEKDETVKADMDQQIEEVFFVVDGKIYRCANWSALPMEVEFTVDGDTLTLKDNGKDIVLTKVS